MWFLFTLLFQGIYPGLVKTEFVEHSGHGREVYNIASYVKSEQIADCVLFALSAPSGTQVINPNNINLIYIQ